MQRHPPLLRFSAYAYPHQTALTGQTKRARKRAQSSGSAEISRFFPLWDQAAYNDAFRVVRGYIAAGDIYQANLTFPLTATTNTCSESPYAALAVVQPVQHGALVLQDGLPDILSLAPELFFRTNAQGRIQTLPMKGTQPRHCEPAQDRTP